MPDAPYYGDLLTAVVGPAAEGPPPPPAPTGFYAPLLDQLLNPHLADQPARRQAMDMERARAVAAKEDSGPQLFGLNRPDVYRYSVPFFGVVKRTVEDEDYKDAKRAFDRNEATADDIKTVARYEQEQARVASQGTEGQIARGLASIPALVGESELGPARFLKAPPGSSFGKQTLRAGASGPLIPSLVVPEAEKRSIEQGGEAYDVKNAAPAVGMAALQNAILGTVARQTGTVPGGLAPRVVAGAAIGVAEQAGADVVAGAVDEVLPEAYKTRTKYGLVGDLVRGDTDAALKRATVQAVTFAAFSALHGGEHAPVVKKYAAAVDALEARGLPPELVGPVVGDAIDPVAAAVGSRDLKAARARVEAMPDDPLKDYAQAVVDSLPDGFQEPAGLRKPQGQGLATPVNATGEHGTVQRGRLARTYDDAPPIAPGSRLGRPAPEPTGNPAEPAIAPLGGRGERDAALEATQAAVKGGKSGVYVDMDVDNAKGLDRAVGGPEKAAGHIRSMVELVREELAAIPGATAEVFRHAGDPMGDEHSAVVTGATKAQVNEALARARHRIGEHAAAAGLAEVPHAKGEGRPAGVGLSMFAEPLAAGRPWKHTVTEAEAGTESVKARRVGVEPVAATAAPKPPAARGRLGRPGTGLSEWEQHVLDQTRQGVSGPDLADARGVTRQAVDAALSRALRKSGEGLDKEAFRAKIADEARERMLDRIERTEQRNPETNQPVRGVDLGELHNLPPREADRALAAREGKRSKDLANEDFHAKKIKTLLKEIDRAGGFDQLPADRREAVTRELADLQQHEENRSRPPRQQPAGRKAATPEPGAVEAPGPGQAAGAGPAAVERVYRDTPGAELTDHFDHLLVQYDAELAAAKTEAEADAVHAKYAGLAEEATAAHLTGSAAGPAPPAPVAPSDEPIPFFRLPWQKKPAPPGPGGTPPPPAAPPSPSGVLDEVRTLLAPATRSGPAKVGGGTLRANLAVLEHKLQAAEYALQAGVRYFDGLVLAARGDPAKLRENFLAFTDPIQTGRIDRMGPDMKVFAETVRKLYDERTAAVTGRKLIDGGKLIENYVTQLWADPRRPDATPEEIGRLLGGRRPFAGREGFKKQRLYETYRDGIEAGLVPKDWNPVRTLLAGLHQIDKSVMAHDTVQELKENGLWEFVRLGGDRKPGWGQVSDKIASVFAPAATKVREYFDKRQMEGLERFAASLGLKLRRPTTGPVGMAPGDEVVTRFGTPEEILAHEIGHQLDKKYDMARGLQAPGLASEMEALANLRASGRVSQEYAAYLQQPNERAANLVAAYLHAPELLRQTAPLSAEWFEALIASHPELRPLREIKPSLELGQRDQMLRLAGPMLTGHYTTPNEVVTLFDNHLSPSLHGRSAIYAGVRHAANALNSFQLGFSAFHAGFVTMDAQVSAVALGLKQLSRGDFAAGIKTLAAGAVPGVAPVRSFLLGTKVGREYFAPSSQGAEVAGLVELLEQAGGRAKMDVFHGGDRVEAFRKAVAAVRYGQVGKLPSALLNALPALAEAVQKPVMEVLVPRMKMGVFAELARYELDKNPNMTREELRDALGKSWDSVENRLGQLTYDNLFWNRTFKDVLMLGVRSVGWNVGTVRELAGGLRDVPRGLAGLRSGRGVSDRLAYTAALPMVAALWGAIYGYLFGEPPTETKDYFFPKTGRKRKDGAADRVSLPSYVRDVAALTNRADEGPVRIGSNVWGMAKHKLNPLLGTVAEMLENQDFYGKAIYNPADPTVQKARDLAAHVLKAFEPLAVRSARQQGEQGQPLGQQAQGFVGITPAPSYVVHTAEEQRQAEQKRAVTVTPLKKRELEERKKRLAAPQR